LLLCPECSPYFPALVIHGYRTFATGGWQINVRHVANTRESRSASALGSALSLKQTPPAARWHCVSGCFAQCACIRELHFVSDFGERAKTQIAFSIVRSK